MELLHTLIWLHGVETGNFITSQQKSNAASVMTCLSVARNHWHLYITCVLLTADYKLNALFFWRSLINSPVTILACGQMNFFTFKYAHTILNYLTLTRFCTRAHVSRYYEPSIHMFLIHLHLCYHITHNHVFKQFCLQDPKALKDYKLKN